MKDEIIRMARDAGAKFDPQWGIAYNVGTATFERFYNLSVQHERERIKEANAPEIEKVNAFIKALEEAVLREREECAKVADKYSGGLERNYSELIADEIRARGEKQ